MEVDAEREGCDEGSPPKRPRLEEAACDTPTTETKSEGRESVGTAGSSPITPTSRTVPTASAGRIPQVKGVTKTAVLAGQMDIRKFFPQATGMKRGVSCDHPLFFSRHVSRRFLGGLDFATMAE